MKLLKMKLPTNLANQFPSDLAVVGGEARLAAYCLIHKQEWPKSYEPRDLDYLRVANEGENPEGIEGIVKNEATTSGDLVVDRLVVSSLIDYFNQVDQHTNAVVVADGTLILTDEALKCFVEKRVRMNLSHPKLLEKGARVWEYLALRACIQVGLDVRTGIRYHRHGACSLHGSIVNNIDYRSLRTNWYWKTYCQKMQQVKSGKH